MTIQMANELRARLPVKPNYLERGGGGVAKQCHGPITPPSVTGIKCLGTQFSRNRLNVMYCMTGETTRTFRP
jgi:hypothetical protein